MRHDFSDVNSNEREHSLGLSLLSELSSRDNLPNKRIERILLNKAVNFIKNLN